MPKVGYLSEDAKGAALGHAGGWRLAGEAMGIDWMRRDELTQAIPPRFTEYIGKQLLACSRANTTPAAGGEQ